MTRDATARHNRHHDQKGRAGIVRHGHGGIDHDVRRQPAWPYKPALATMSLDLTSIVVLAVMGLLALMWDIGMTEGETLTAATRYRITLCQDYRGWFATVETMTPKGTKIGWTNTVATWSECMQQATVFIAKFGETNGQSV